MYFSQLDRLWNLFSTSPNATAYIMGSAKYPNVKGITHFYQLPQGVLVVTEVMGLPYAKGECTSGIHALHIHEGESCSGNQSDPFANARMHYNPHQCPHPQHAGDMPPLFSNQGYALSVFYTERFRVKDIIGKTVIVHEKIDDFSTQPSGNAGEKIACGEIIAIMLN